MIELKDGDLITGGIDQREDKIAARMFEMLNDGLIGAVGQYGCDLHNYFFNEDYAFTYDDEAEDACVQVSVFSAIRLVQKYEIDNFGETHIEIEPCKIANMLVNIYGEYLLQVAEAVSDEQYNRELTAEDLKQIESRIQAWCDHNLPYNSDYRTLEEQVWDYYESY